MKRWVIVLLVVLAVINSAVAAYYYLRLVIIMYMREPEGEVSGFPKSAILWVGIAIALAGTIILGILPDGILEAARSSVTLLL